ncbi:MAG: radical SAM protein [Candidatus Peregrinibacteria bacterium]|nr:radical SAM protein [Candidatus Peregrinibacteria bacterium]
MFKDTTVIKTIQMQCGQAYVVQLADGSLIELGDVYLPNENKLGTRPYRYRDFGNISDKNKRVITLCTMVGCSMKCKFCSVRQTFKRLLTAEDIVNEVEFCLEEGKKYGRSSDPMESKEFNVLYTRMGEPTANITNVITSIQELVRRWPHVKIGMSTTAPSVRVYDFLKYPDIAKHIMMQFSVHGTDEDMRSGLFMAPTGKVLMGLPEIAKFAKDFRKLNPRMISLNFILFQGFNYDFKRLREIFDVEDVYLRLSPLNATENSVSFGLRGLIREEDVDQKAPISSQELKDIIQQIEECGFSYAFAPAIDEEITYKAACGQALEMLKADQLKTFGEMS